MKHVSLFLLIGLFLISCSNAKKSKSEKEAEQIAWHDSIMDYNTYWDSVFATLPPVTESIAVPYTSNQFLIDSTIGTNSKFKFNVFIVVKIPGDSVGAKIVVTKNGKPFKTIKSDGLLYAIAFDLNAKYLITSSKKGYSTKIVSLDTYIPKGREVEEFARFTMDIELRKTIEDNKRDTSIPVGGVAYSEEEQDFNVVQTK